MRRLIWIFMLLILATTLTAQGIIKSTGAYRLKVTSQDQMLGPGENFTIPLTISPINSPNPAPEGIIPISARIKINDAQNEIADNGIKLFLSWAGQIDKQQMILNEATRSYIGKLDSSLIPDQGNLMANISVIADDKLRRVIGAIEAVLETKDPSLCENETCSGSYLVISKARIGPFKTVRATKIVEALPITILHNITRQREIEAQSGLIGPLSTTEGTKLNIVFGDGSNSMEVAGMVSFSNRIALQKDLKKDILFPQNFNFRRDNAVLVGTPCENSFIPIVLNISYCSGAFTEDVGLFAYFDFGNTRGYLISGNSSRMVRKTAEYMARGDTGIENAPFLLKEQGNDLIELQLSQNPQMATFATTGYDKNKNNIPDSIDRDKDSDGINDWTQTIIGNENYISSNLKLGILINQTPNNIVPIFSKTLAGRTRFVITMNNTPIILLKHNLGQSRLDFTKVKIEDTSLEKGGGIMISGLEIQPDQEKSVFIRRELKPDQHICLLDQEIGSLQEVSSDCSGPDELKIPCDGENRSNYSCTILWGEGTTRLRGLKHSGIRILDEIPASNPSSIFMNVSIPNNTVVQSVQNVSASPPQSQNNTVIVYPGAPAPRGVIIKSEADMTITLNEIQTDSQNLDNPGSEQERTDILTSEKTSTPVSRKKSDKKSDDEFDSIYYVPIIGVALMILCVVAIIIVKFIEKEE